MERAVGVGSWATIAPAGTLPFESPINLTGPTIDLSQVVTVNDANQARSKIINNGAQIQVQLPSNGQDTLTLAGVPYTLSQFHDHDPSENHDIDVNAQGQAIDGLDFAIARNPSYFAVASVSASHVTTASAHALTFPPSGRGRS